MNVLDVGDGRHAPVPFGFFVGRAFQVIGGELPADVAAAKEGCAVGDAAVGYCRFEAVAVTDEPVGHKAAVAAADHAEALLVDIALLYDGVYARQNVLRVFFGPRAAHRQREVVSIADAATRVGVEHDVAVGGQHVHFVNETIAILCVRSAVNLDDQWVLARRIEVGRLDYPPIHGPAVSAGVGDVFGRGELQLVE